MAAAITFYIEYLIEVLFAILISFSNVLNSVLMLDIGINLTNVNIANNFDLITLYCIHNNLWLIPTSKYYSKMFFYRWNQIWI